MWNPALLTLAANPALTRIVLASSEHAAFTPADAPLSPRALWLRAARAHARLFALVRAGSVLARERARTTLGPLEDGAEPADACTSLAPPLPSAGPRPTRALSESTFGH
jgi:hypothetical protein